MAAPSWTCQRSRPSFPFEHDEIPVRITGKDYPPRCGECASVRIAEVGEGPFLRSGKSVDRLQRAGRSLNGIRNIDAAQKIVPCTIGLWRTGEDVALG